MLYNYVSYSSFLLALAGIYKYHPLLLTLYFLSGTQPLGQQKLRSLEQETKFSLVVQNDSEWTRPHSHALVPESVNPGYEGNYHVSHTDSKHIPSFGEPCSSLPGCCCLTAPVNDSLKRPFCNSTKATFLGWREHGKTRGFHEHGPPVTLLWL